MPYQFDEDEIGSLIETGVLVGPEIPAWIEQDITGFDVRCIAQGGCASGAYMPAVTYYTAKQTMAQHGDDIVDFIVERLGLQGLDAEADSFGGMCCHLVSTAVELWSFEVDQCLDELAEEGDAA